MHCGQEECVLVKSNQHLHQISYCVILLKLRIERNDKMSIVPVSGKNSMAKEDCKGSLEREANEGEILLWFR